MFLKTAARAIEIILFIFLTLFSAHAQKVTPENALESYLNNGDKTFKWELKESFSRDDLTFYQILLTSQKWREFTWTHQLTLIVPKENRHDDALLFITGGSNSNKQPNWNSKKR
ncbi:PhoPQ-activated protein PqaA family protein [Dyadobacter sp. 676]|uniref:PhoPQ-activated protein PqaA family protein n=1 Tax=Dyadobacter sp. 676 TaxID=3088362 RepID=A0AAU8FEH6_9BACT